MRFIPTIVVFIVLLTLPQVFAQKKGEELSSKAAMSFTRAFIDAGKEKNLGNPQAALELYQRCLEIDPTASAVYYEIGQIYQSQQRNSDAEQMYRKATELEEDNDWYQLRLGDMLDAQGKFKESTEVWEKLYEAHPRNLQYIDRYGTALIYSGKSKQAIKFYDKVESEMGVNQSLSVTKQKIYLRENQLDKAAEEIQKLINAYPKETDYYGMLADLYSKSGKPEKALETYEKAIEIDPSNPFIQLSLAEFYDRQEEFEKSEKYLDLAFGNKELDIDTKVTILLRLYRSAEQDLEIRSQALKLCEILAETHPQNPKAAAVYGDFLYLDEKWSAARDQYVIAVEKDPSKFVIWSQLLFIDSELSDEKSMLKHSTQAMEYFPSQPVPYLFNGLANNQLEEYADAAKSLRMGISLVVGNPPLSAQMLASLGDAYHELERHISSDSCYDLSLRFDPENPYVLNNYAYFLALRGERLDEALKMSAKTLELVPNSASYLDTYGWVLYKAGNYEEAKKYLKQALENGAASSGEVLEHMGDTLYKLGKVNEAVDYWTKARAAGDASENIDKKIDAQELLD